MKGEIPKGLDATEGHNLGTIKAFLDGDMEPVSLDPSSLSNACQFLPHPLYEFQKSEKDTENTVQSDIPGL